MSFRLEMLQVARLAPQSLGDSAELVRDLVLSRQCEDGGFRGRDSKSDLYYSGFAVDALTALSVELPEERILPYLQGFGDGDGLDFVHLCCLARIWSAMKTASLEREKLATLLSRVESFRTVEGGYNQKPDAKHGSAYGCLLAYGAYADHKLMPPDPPGILRCLDALRTTDGAWTNDLNITMGNSLATGAAVTLCRNLHHPLTKQTSDWLLGCFFKRGGFLPFPGAPMPDLLSTAVTLHALEGMQVSLEAIKDRCLDFVDSLWSGSGGFHGHWADDELDIEYTYYGLLALGHLAL